MFISSGKGCDGDGQGRRGQRSGETSWRSEAPGGERAGQVGVGRGGGGGAGEGGGRGRGRGWYVTSSEAEEEA